MANIIFSWSDSMFMDVIYRKLGSTKTTSNASLKCAIDHILDAQNKGEINEDNVLYIVENINVAGKSPFYINFGNFAIAHLLDRVEFS